MLTIIPQTSPGAAETPGLSLSKSMQHWGLDLLYHPDIVSELRFLFPQPGNRSPETYIPFPGLDDQESSKNDEKRAGAEIKNTRQELHDQDADRGKREAGLHIGMHGSLP